MANSRYTGESTHDMVGDMRGQLTVNNYLNAAQLGATMGIAANQREGNRLQREGNALQREANAKLDETNRRLGVLGRRAAETNRLVAEQIAEQSKTNTALKRLDRQASITNQLLAVQIKGQAILGAKIDTSNVIAFATWRDGTPAGAAYKEWARSAERTMGLIDSYTRRMAHARELDIELNSKAMIAQDPQHLMGDWAPVLPDDPRPAPPIDPRDTMEPPALADADDGLLSKVLLKASIIVVIAGAIFGFYKGWTVFEFEQPTGFFAWLVSAGNFIQKLLSALWWTLLIGLGSLIPAGILAFLAALTPSARKAEEVRDKAKEERKAYEQIIAAYEKDFEEYQAKLKRWEETHGDAAVRAETGKHEDDVRRFREACVDKARELTVPPTHWAVRSPLPFSQNLAKFIENAQVAPPTEDLLPDTGMPTFATVASLPVSAPNMRAELLAILAENADNPEARVKGPIGDPRAEWCAPEAPHVTVTASNAL